MPVGRSRFPRSPGAGRTQGRYGESGHTQNGKDGGPGPSSIVFSSPGGAGYARPVGGPWQRGPDRSQGTGPLDSGYRGFRVGKEGYGRVMGVSGEGRWWKVGALRGGVELVLRFQGGLG